MKENGANGQALKRSDELLSNVAGFAHSHDDQLALGFGQPSDGLDRGIEAVPGNRVNLVQLREVCQRGRLDVEHVDAAVKSPIHHGLLSNRVLVEAEAIDGVANLIGRRRG